MDSDGPIIVTMGDPHGVGPEVLLRTLSSLDSASLARVRVVGDPDYLEKLSRELNLGSLPPIRFSVPGAFPYPPRWGVISRSAGHFAMACLEMALQEMKERAAGLLVTAPIHKEAARMAGFEFPGQTEYVASHFPGNAPAMAFLSEPLKLVLVTVHVPLRDVPDQLSCEEIERCGELLLGALRGIGVQNPRIAVAGLNPHASESGQFGTEEEAIIEPAVLRLRRGSTSACFAGPFSPDTIFQRVAEGEFDGIVALYHDQALTPLKLLAFRSAANVTLGLPVVRTSPCHGTGFDIAGQGCADPGSMESAFRWGSRLAGARPTVPKG